MTLPRFASCAYRSPGATEQIQWGADLVFKVGGKMFCVACTEVAPNVTSFKCDDETFAELCERDGMIPAPYLARAKWVALERWDALEDRELAPLTRTVVYAGQRKVAEETQAALSGRGFDSGRRRQDEATAKKGRGEEEIKEVARAHHHSDDALLPWRWAPRLALRNRRPRRPPTGGR